MGKFSEIVGALKPGADVLPVNPPNIPPYTPDMTKDEAARAISDWEESSERSRRENDARFERALVRVEMCGFLKGLLHPFSASEKSDLHYPWCPSREWKKFTRSGKS